MTQQELINQLKVKYQRPGQASNQMFDFLTIPLINRNLRRLGHQVAISDSPIRIQSAFAENFTSAGNTQAEFQLTGDYIRDSLMTHGVVRLATTKEKIIPANNLTELEYTVDLSILKYFVIGSRMYITIRPVDFPNGNTVSLIVLADTIPNLEFLPKEFEDTFVDMIAADLIGGVTTKEQ